MKPNILFVICDDLTWGDLSLHGNPHLDTPHLDKMGHESTRMTRYCTGPLCTPARAAIMTGRHPQRTGAIDTYVGRAMMHHDEVTLAQMLKSVGYDTGMFGKWHLGDCNPMRPCDKGFDDTLWHASGGLGQHGNPGMFDKRSGYFDPLLLRNGDTVESKGYCTDIFTDAATDWIAKRQHNQPWFAYVGYNAPHAPHIIGDEWVQRVKGKDLPEKWQKIYGMVANIDHNVGKLLDTLDRYKLRDNTIVVFTSDHGQCQSSVVDGRLRYNGNLRGMKSTMYEGGIRVPCLVRWPGQLPASDCDALANPIDWVPTFSSVCGFVLPGNKKIDGSNMLPVMRKKSPPTDRAVCMQWHRGDEPKRFKNATTITQQYKWYRPDSTAPDELYDIHNDPGEEHNLAPRKPDVVAALIAHYEKWFDEVAAERPDNYAPPRIVLGHPASPTVLLSLQDARLLGTQESWGTTYAGYWLVDVHAPGRYRFDIHLGNGPLNREWVLRCGSVEKILTIPTTCYTTELTLDAGPQTVSCLAFGPVEDLRPNQTDPGVRTVGQIEVTRIGT
ncbi:MAG: sulfatase-like hydrolase/transferase [Phycisphaera sp.]|nr:sulfatase-like hydrolase/transferase [Phycisphaera sp.]